jgi:hypothetical protein
MTTTEELRKHLIQVIKEYPDLKSDIVSLWQLCLDEIEEGGSQIHEIELCLSDVDELIKEYKEAKNPE